MKKDREVLRILKERSQQCLRSRYVLPIALGAIVLVLHTSGYCANTPAAEAEMDTMANTTIQTIFAPWVRKTALGFGAGFGLFKAYMGGSVVPLLTWGGLGLAVNFIPKLIGYITAIGG